MRPWTVNFLLVVVGCASDAQALPFGCFSRHLEEAIVANSQRAPRYYAASHGGSAEISARLISGEIISLGVAQLIDLEALPFQEAGIPVLCNDFVPMRDAPPFVLVDRAPFPKATDSKPYDANKIIQQLNELVNAQNYEGIESLLTSELANTDAEPRLQCMERHVLSSIRRVAHFAPKYLRLAEKFKTPDLNPLLSNEILSQLPALSLAVGLDNASLDMHEAGTPIICQDVPPIGLDPLPQFKDVLASP